jgi:hypothetical protein
MKKIFLLALATSLSLFVACGDDSSGSPMGGGSGTEQLSEESVKAFFPTGYKTEDVAAWYATETQILPDGDQTKTSLNAVYLFKDGSFIVTESTQKVKSNGSKKLSNEIVAKGTWTGGDDFANGTFTVSFGVGDENVTMPLEVVNGILSISPDGNVAMSFKLQSSTVPAPTEAGEVVEKADSGSNSSKSDEVCSVTTSGNSVTMTVDMDEEHYVMTATLDGDQIVATVNGETQILPSEGNTFADMKQSAYETCEELNSIANDNDYDYGWDDDYDYSNDYGWDDDYDYDEDNYAPSDYTCDVIVGDNSVKVVISMGDISSATIYSLTDSGYMISYEADGLDLEPTEIPTPMTMEELKLMGDESCKAVNENN